MDQSLVIRNGKVLLPNSNIAETEVRSTDGIIDALGSELKAQEVIDASGGYVLPGLIDIHTHGIGYESAGEGDLRQLAALEAKRGATTFYPTLFAPAQVITDQLRRHRSETNELRDLPQIPGFRLESPYLHHCGGGVSDDICPISTAVTNMLLEAGNGLVKILDIAPELDGAADTTYRLTSQGIAVSIAHTYATIEQAKAVVDAGATMVTHLFDTFEVPLDDDTGVYPCTLIDYLLVEDRVNCEIIGDGTHVAPMLVEKTFRCKSPERLVFVTDSNVGAGLPTGKLTLPGGWGEAFVDGPNNGVRLVDRGMTLSGSALTPIDAFHNAVRLFGKGLAIASKICSATPARIMGLNKGIIAPRMDADFIVLSNEMELLYTICAGKVIYRRDS